MIDFSIIIPVYNTKRVYLKKCLDSVIAQNTVNIEVIIVDDGSTNDETVSVLNEISSDELYASVRLIKQKHMGVSTARNTGIVASKGKYLLFLDADDMLREGCLKQLSLFVIQSMSDILFFKHYLCKELIVGNNSFDDTLDVKCIYDLREIASEVIIPQGKYKNYIVSTPWAKIIRRKLVVDSNIRFQPDLPRSQDSVFILDCVMHSKEVSFLDYTGYIYNSNSYSTCAKYDSMVDEKLLLVYKAINNRVSKYDLKLDAQLQAAKWGLFFDSIKSGVFHRDNPKSFFSKRKSFFRIFKKYDLPYNGKMLEHLTPERRILAKCLKYSLYDLVAIAFNIKANRTR